MAGYFSGQAESLNQNKDPKISYRFGVLCNFSELCLFCNSYRMKSSFPDVFDELFFYAFSSSPKSVSSSYHQTNTHHVGVSNSHRSNQFKADIKSRTRLAWNTDMWLRNLPKTACATLRSFQMSNHIAKFSSWKLITARWILRQHNTNAITTYFK